MKPLSKSHPTLWKRLDDANGMDGHVGYMNCRAAESIEGPIQSCTVDLAEHEKAKAYILTLEGEVHLLGEGIAQLNDEVELLKKELAEEKAKKFVAKTLADNADTVSAQGAGFTKGLFEGERVAMEKVRAAIGPLNPKTRAASISVDYVLQERRRIAKELGLDKNERGGS